MNAIVQTRYGSPDAFELREVETPKLSKPTDVLVRVHAASLHAGDVFMMRGVPYFTRFVVGFPKPRNYIPGLDAAGTVEAVGEGVTKFRRGDEIFGSFSHTCAELARARESQLERKPASATFEEAAAVPTSAIAALHGIRDAGKVKPGMKVLINGASGGVGTFAVQIAKAYGAEVTAVCSGRNLALMRSIGADHAVDYTKEDFTRGDARYDVILDNVANHPLSHCRRVLTPTGKHIPNSGNAGMPYIVKALVVSMLVRRQGKGYVATLRPGDLVELTELIEADKLRAVLDEVYPLERFCDAMRHLSAGHTRGKVVIRVCE